MAVLCSVYSGYMARTFVLTLLIVVAQDGYSCQTPAKIRGLTIEQVRSRLAAGQVQEGRCHERVSTIPVGLSAERGQACGSGRPQARCGGAVHEGDRHQSCQSGVAKAFPDIVGRTGWNCGGLGDCDEEAAIAQAARAAGGRCRQRVRGVDEDRQGAA